MKLTKYNASGNTFVIFYTQDEKDYSKDAIRLCKEHNTDGLIALVPHQQYDFKWLFYNNDGSTASMCGNGTRAVAHFALTNNIATSPMRFLTGAGVIECIVEDDIVQTTMTQPKILKEEFTQFDLQWYIIDTGVPHLVTIVDDLNKFSLDICSKMRYQYDANVNFAKIDNDILYVRTYERGVEDETLACGTGMTACFLRANQLNLIPNQIQVIPKSKEILYLKKDNNNIYFKGKVTSEYSMEIDDL